MLLSGLLMTIFPLFSDALPYVCVCVCVQKSSSYKDTSCTGLVQPCFNATLLLKILSSIAVKF